MTTVGPNNPTSSRQGTAFQAWSNPQNIYADDANNATCVINASSVDRTRDLYSRGYGFSIPSTAIITGIEIENKRRGSSSSNPIRDSYFSLVNGDVGNSSDYIGTTKDNGSAAWSTTEETIVLGGSSDMWGLTTAELTPAVVNSGNFGYLQRAATAATANRTASVNLHRITVYYTEPGYTLPANTGAFSFTGQAANLLAARKIAANQGTFVLTGQAAGFSRTRRVMADKGAFTFTGNAANLFRNSPGASSGAFALSGKPVGLRVNRLLIANGRAFTLTGNAAILARSRKITADSGLFVLTGLPADLRRFSLGNAVTPNSRIVRSDNSPRIAVSIVTSRAV